MFYTDYFAEYILYPYSSPYSRREGIPIWYENYSNPKIQHIYIPPMVVQKRVSGKIICRLRTIPPRVGELFYVRILLLHKSA